MTLKDTLKRMKLNESTISMLLGALVIIIVGVAAVNYLGNEGTGETIPALESEDLGDNAINTNLPTEHTVAAGEDLWKISEQYYDTGYNWVAIAEANQISDPNQLSEGDTITIPALDVETNQPAVSPTPDTLADADTSGDVVEPTITLAPTTTPEPTKEPTLQPTRAEEVSERDSSVDHEDHGISGETYSVVQGDTLWHIAQRAYGDPYRWVEIAEANNLENPDLIHPGNSFTIPR